MRLPVLEMVENATSRHCSRRSFAVKRAVKLLKSAKPQVIKNYSKAGRRIRVHLLRKKTYSSRFLPDSVDCCACNGVCSRMPHGIRDAMRRKQSRSASSRQTSNSYFPETPLPFKYSSTVARISSTAFFASAFSRLLIDTRPKSISVIS